MTSKGKTWLGGTNSCLLFAINVTLNLSFVFKFVPFFRYLSFRSQSGWSIRQITENTVLFSSHSMCSNLWSKNVSLTSFLPEVAKIEIWKFCNIVSFSEFQILSFYILWRKPCPCWYVTFFACPCHCHSFNPSASLVSGSVLKLLLEFYSWAFIMYVIQCMCLLWVTRGACNPNLQVVIKHASHLCSQHSFVPPLRMNGMHKMQFDHTRFDLLPLVIWSCVFWPSVTGNLRKAQRWSKSVWTSDCCHCFSFL